MRILCLTATSEGLIAGDHSSVTKVLQWTKPSKVLFYAVFFLLRLRVKSYEPSGPLVPEGLVVLLTPPGLIGC